LVLGKNYRFRVIAFNKNGDSAPSPVASVLYAAVPFAPKAPVQTKSDATMIAIEW
jgi:hypothetical protein